MCIRDRCWEAHRWQVVAQLRPRSSLRRRPLFSHDGPGSGAVLRRRPALRDPRARRGAAREGVAAGRARCPRTISLLAVSGQTEIKKPNILYIIVDDQSPFDFKFYNPNSQLNAPVIEKLAADGMVIDGAYHMGSWVGGVCTASRHMIMSGRTVWHIPDRKFRKPPANPNALNPNLVPADLVKNTLAAVFNRAGYDTMRTCKRGNSYDGANKQFNVVHDSTKRGGTAETGSAWHAERVLNYLNEREMKKDVDPFLIYFGFSHPHDVRDGTPELLKKYGAVVPKGIFGLTVDEVVEKAKSLKTKKYVLKAQIHAGGRGKAGGVKILNSLKELRKASKELLGKTLVTHQTGPEGREVKRLYVEESSNIEKEFYLSCLVDRASSKIAFISSDQGGMDIEEVAKKTPEKIITTKLETVSYTHLTLPTKA